MERQQQQREDDEQSAQEEQEHEVYGGEIPDYGEMDADVEFPGDEEVDPNSKNLEDMKKRLKEIEEEAGALREMQAKVEKEMGIVQGNFSRLYSLLLASTNKIRSTICFPIEYRFPWKSSVR
uniref:Polyadenylate-binding protein 2-like n=1 Tax=Nelumbo nucifera TaxID=4432 RepID=A0A822ZSY6_NELNU|nr:TPA_asm: hypothetical protein HUJ06_017567 [Nelumbo nucifera]